MKNVDVVQCQCNNKEMSCRPTHTYQMWPSVINIVEMGEGNTPAFLILPIKLTLGNGPQRGP